MTAFHTCRACKFEKTDCEPRRLFAALIKPLNITVVKWRCASRVKLYPPGAPCYARTFPSHQESEWDEEPPKLWFPAVICRQRTATSFVVFIEPGALPTGATEPVETLEQPERWAFHADNRGYCKIPLYRLRPRDGEVTAVCHRCSSIAGKDQCPDANCPGLRAKTSLAEVPF